MCQSLFCWCPQRLSTVRITNSTTLGRSSTWWQKFRRPRCKLKTHFSVRIMISTICAWSGTPMAEICEIFEISANGFPDRAEIVEFIILILILNLRRDHRICLGITQKHHFRLLKWRIVNYRFFANSFEKLVCQMRSNFFLPAWELSQTLQKPFEHMSRQFRWKCWKKTSAFAPRALFEHIRHISRTTRCRGRGILRPVAESKYFTLNQPESLFFT